jgi:predicted MFS family arabinose efflux permease
VLELHADHPMLDVRLFRNWNFANTQILVAVLASGFFAVLFYVPLFLQQAQGITPVNTGLAMLPEAIEMGIGAAMGGMLYDKIGARWPAAIGIAVAVYGSWLMCDFTADVTRPEIMAWTAIRGFGYALAVIPVMSAAMATVPATSADGASAFTNVIYRVSGALILAVLNSLVAAQQSQLMAERSSLLPATGPTVDPRIHAMQQHGPAGLLPLWENLTTKVAAQVLGNIFLVMTIVTAIALPLALTFTRTVASRADRAALEIAL